MAEYGDITGLPPVPFDGAPDLESLTWPWDQAAAAPVLQGAPAVTPTPDAAGAAAPTIQGSPAAEQPAAPLQPGLGIPQSALDALVPPSPASPLPQVPPAIAPATAIPQPPVVAAPAAEQPLTPAAGATAPPLDSIVPPPIDAAVPAPSPPGEPALPPAPSPLSPAPVALPAVEPVTGMLEPAGAPAESVLAGLPGAPPTPEQRYARVAGEYQADPGKLLDRLQQPGALDTDTQRYLDDFTARDPAGAAVLRQRLADAGTTKLAADRARVAKDDFDRQMANIKVRNDALAVAAKKSAQIDADATEMANTKVGYHPSTFQRIAGVIAAVVGGLYQGRTGAARNPGLDALNDTINRDLEEQKMNLANKRDVLQQRRSALGDLMARTNDQYQSDETMRLAALKYADEQLAQQQLNFAPDGTRGLNLAAMRAGINAQIAGNKQTQEQKLFEDSLKVQNASREQQLANETSRHNRATEGVEWEKLGIERLKASKDGATLTPDMLRAVMTQPGQPSPPIPPIPMSLKDYGSWLESTKKGQEAALGGREYSVGDVRPIRDADGNIIGTESKPLVNKDGKLFQAPSTDEAKQLRLQLAGVNTTNQLIDEMVGGIQKYGGSSKFFKSPEWQAMQANKESLLFALHQAYGVTGFRPGVLEQMEKALGGQDPTAYAKIQSDAVPGLETAKKSLNVHFNANLRSAQYTGEEYSPPNLSPPEELPRLADRTFAESQPGALDKWVEGLRQAPEALANPAGLGPSAGAGPYAGPAIGPTGLSERDTATVQDLVRRYQKGTPATRERVAAELTAAMGADRPTLRAGILGLVDGESPELYQQLLKVLPADELAARQHDQTFLRQLGGQ